MDAFVSDYPELAEDIFGGPEALAGTENAINQWALEYKNPKLGGVNTSNTNLASEADKWLARQTERRFVGPVARVVQKGSNPEGAAQKKLRDLLLDNTQRNQQYTGEVPQLGGLFSTLLSPNDPKMNIPFIQ